ncbi:MAG: hypothetical protein LUD17_06685 [Bacteroidales bacterium]|nr:hypothetical protein [Bacteroidales bacterium]
MCESIDNKVDYSIVVEEELLARIIFHPSMYYRGRINPAAYNLQNLPNGPEKGVSMIRLKYVSIEKEVYERIKPRIEGDKVCGYATIYARECRACRYEEDGQIIKVEVRGSKSEKAKGHANIFFYQNEVLQVGKDQNITCLAVTAQLANNSKFHPFE